MLNYLSILGFTAIILLNSTNNPTTIASQKISNIENVGETAFWNSLKAVQGKTFEGTIVNAPANDDFFGKKLVMHILYSDDETILIPFNVGDNLSRTWIFTNKKNRIQLKHDHRMKNGENDKITMYGGIASNQGTSTMQFFPADEETQKLIPAAFSNVWWVTLDNNTFTYNLRRIGSDRVFTVSFDLTKEIAKPAPSWGWENFKK
jgi:hypothetical protein